MAAVAALLGAAVLALVLWLEANSDAPTGLVVASVVLALVVLPFTVGAAAAWWRHARERRDSASASAWAAVLVEWALLVVATVVSLVTDYQHQTAYLSDPRNLVEVVLVLGVFGFAGAIMGAIGGAVAARVRRTRPAPDPAPGPLGAAP